MAVSKRIRTDLALETTERFKEENTEIRGVEIQEDYDEEKDVRTTVVRIVTENGAKAMGRPQGTYITIEAPDLSVPDEDYHREISEEISKHLKQLIDLKKEKSILVVGLGNAGITADALGPQVVDNLLMTRHIIKEYGLRGIKHEYQRKGIIFVAAAIGDDKENIERIYGDSFLDITDLNQLPTKLTAVVKRHIRV